MPPPGSLAHLAPIGRPSSAKARARPFRITYGGKRPNRSISAKAPWPDEPIPQPRLRCVPHLSQTGRTSGRWKRCLRARSWGRMSERGVAAS
jgi:hypothetical protein